MTTSISITATGNISSEIKYFKATDTMKELSSFNIASTPRHFNREKKTFSDGVTTWFEVHTYGALAKHIQQSLNMGDAVIVTGILTTKEWTNSKNQPGTTNIIIASAVGPNLLLGNGNFSREGKADNEKSHDEDTTENEQLDESPLAPPTPNGTWSDNQ